jgi:hypothetical protein
MARTCIRLGSDATHGEYSKNQGFHAVTHGVF